MRGQAIVAQTCTISNCNVIAEFRKSNVLYYCVTDKCSVITVTPNTEDVVNLLIFTCEQDRFFIFFYFLTVLCSCSMVYWSLGIQMQGLFKWIQTEFQAWIKHTVMQIYVGQSKKVEVNNTKQRSITGGNQNTEPDNTEKRNNGKSVNVWEWMCECFCLV